MLIPYRQVKTSGLFGLHGDLLPHCDELLIIGFLFRGIFSISRICAKWCHICMKLWWQVLNCQYRIKKGTACSGSCYDFVLFTQCSLVTLNGEIDLGDHWWKLWLIAWRYEAITWTNADLPFWMVLWPSHENNFAPKLHTHLIQPVPDHPCFGHFHQYACICRHTGQHHKV